MSDTKIAVSLIKVGVNMGDHGETIHRSLNVDPSMTIADLVDATLRTVSWQGTPGEFEYDNYLTIRVAQDIPEVEPETDTPEPF